MKRITALLVILIFVLSVFCGCGSTPDVGTASPGEVVKLEEKKEITNLGKTVSARPVAAEETDAAFSTAQWKFGLNLFAALSKEEQGNLLVSPYSVAPALAMTANGAAGETQSQMLTVLGGLSAEQLNQGMASVRKTEGEELKSANSIWFRDVESLTVHRDFLQTNADYYGAEIYKAPFTAETADAINGWVKENTDGMIPEIIRGAGGLDHAVSDQCAGV